MPFHVVFRLGIDSFSIKNKNKKQAYGLFEKDLENSFLFDQLSRNGILATDHFPPWTDFTMALFNDAGIYNLTLLDIPDFFDIISHEEQGSSEQMVSWTQTRTFDWISKLKGLCVDKYNYLLLNCLANISQQVIKSWVWFYAKLDLQRSPTTWKKNYLRPWEDTRLTLLLPQNKFDYELLFTFDQIQERFFFSCLLIIF